MKVIKFRMAFEHKSCTNHKASRALPQNPMGELTALLHTPLLGRRGHAPSRTHPLCTPPILLRNLSRYTLQVLPTPLAA